MLKVVRELGQVVKSGWRRLPARGVTYLMCLVMIVASVWAVAGAQAAGYISLFGPKKYTRTQGKPSTWTDTFKVSSKETKATLRITNGSGKETRVSSAVIVLNGKQVVGERDLNRTLPSLERAVTLKPGANTLSVTIKSGPGDDCHGRDHDHDRDHDKNHGKECDKNHGKDHDRDCDKGHDKDHVKNRDKAHDKDHKGDDHNKGRDRDYDRNHNKNYGKDHRGDDRGKDREKDRHDNPGGRHDKGGKGCDLGGHDKHDGKHGGHGEKHDGHDGKHDEHCKDHHGHNHDHDCHNADFLIVEIVGQGSSDTTPPVISAPQPADGSLQNIARPAISATYADNQGGSGIDAASVRITLDTKDITSSCTVGASSVTCAPASDLAEGGHGVAVAVSDLAKNAASLAWRFTTDTIAPRIAVTSPQNGQYLNAPAVTVTGSTDDPTAQISVNGVAATISGATFSAAGITLVEGPNTITVTAVDKAGNRSSTSITVTVDTTLPVITISAPAANSYTNVPTVTVSGTVSKPPVSVTVNGRSATVSGTDFTLPNLSLAEGLNTITVEAVDKAGNKGAASVSLILDTVNPQITITAPTDRLLTRIPALTVTGSVSEKVTSLTINGSPAVVTDLNFSAPLTLTEGSNTITVEAVDRAGNKGTATVSASLDDTPPGAPVLEALTAVTNNSLITVKGSAEAGTSVTLYNGTTKVATTVADQNGQFVFADLTLSDGSNNFSVSALDNAGNESQSSAPVSVVLDTKAPTVTVTDPLDKAILKTPAITVSGTIDDPTATITVNGLPARNNGSTYTLENFTLQEGSNTLLVEARDAAGNKGNATVTVTLDTVPPVVTVTTPVDGLYTNQPLATVSGKISEAASGVTINGRTATVNGTAFTVSDLQFTEGTNTITVEATDLAGNKGSTTVSVTLDTIAPQLSIIGPADGALLNNGQITFGASSAEQVVSVLINGIAAQAGTTGYVLPVTLAEGSNTLTVTATDRAGNSTTSTVTVNLDSTPPKAPVLNPLTTPTRIATVTVSGQAEALSTVKLLNNSQQIGTLKADGAGQFTFPNVTLTEGNNVFVASATDAAGNESPLSAQVVVVLDTKPPVITVTAPQSGTVISDAQTTITGTVDEELSSLTINGSPVTLKGLTFENTLALAAGENSALIVATDLAGNTASATTTILRDNTPPVVAITSPVDGLLTNVSQIQVNGTVDDASATLTVGGAPLTLISRPAPLTGASFGITYQLADGENTIQAVARDKAGNVGQASVKVILDAQAPQVTLSAPTTATAGTDVQITVNATDNRRLTLVDVTADGASLWSASPENAATASQSVSLRLSPALTTGTAVTVRARALDSAGNAGSATTTITVDKTANGPGWLQGKVLDDGRGLALEGAQVSVTDAQNQTQSIVTAADGAWFFELPSGSARVEVIKDGFTSVRRDATVRPSQRTVVLDSRLTPVDTTARPVDTAGGTFKTVLSSASTTATVDVAIPANAITSPADLRLTPISNQGLIAPLPVGWSPLAVADLRLLDPTAGTMLNSQVWSSAATLTLPLPKGVGDNALTASLARYDLTRRVWLATAEVAISAGAATASVQIPQSGQYALLLADPAPLAPLRPAIGDELTAASLTSTDFTLTSTTGRVVPQVSPPKAGLRAAGDLWLSARADATTPPALTSGLIVNAHVAETFNLNSGDTLQSVATVQDIILYRAPCATSIASGATDPFVTGAGLRTTFPVSPSKDFTIVDLLMGKVSLSITAPDNGGGVMVGADGALLLQPDGTSLSIPAGALSSNVPVTVATLPEASVSTLVGSDFRLLRGVDITITGQTLKNSATLSIPAPSDFNPGLPVVVARKLDVKGGSKLKLVAAGKLSGSILSSSTTITTSSATDTITVHGITTTGQYLFLQAVAPIGYISGTISDAGNAPFAGIQVSAQSATLSDLTGGSGAYVLATATGDRTITALDPSHGDQASATAAVQANAKTALNLTVRMVPPRIADISPANASVNVQPTVPVVVTFSKVMDKNSITSATFVVRDAANAVVPGVLTFNVDSTSATFYPNDAFKQETTYTVTVAASVKDLQGYPLGQSSVTSFTIRKTTAPAMPAAGAVSGTFPDADGFITVTGTQGSADPSNTVLLINDTTGEIVSIRPASNGSFTGKVRGQLGDTIKVVLMDYSGNQTLISYLTFKGPDGSYLVTAKGGKIEGEGGSLLEIPEGAFTGPTVIKVTSVQQTALPHPVQEGASFVGAVKIDTGGIPFQKEVQFSIPLPAGYQSDKTPFVATPDTIVNADGSEEKVFVIVDSAKVVDGRLSTACEPFGGVMTPGIFAFFQFPVVNVAIVSGYTYQNMNDTPGYQATPNGTIETPVMDTAGNPVYKYDRPIKGAVIRTPAAWNYVSYSNSSGFYAGYTTVFGNVGADDVQYTVTAIHPLTMRKATITAYLNSDQNIRRLNFKLADKDTIQPDKTPPVINLSLQTAPGQPLENRLTSGTMPVGTELKLSLFIVDQSDVNSTLTVEYNDPATQNWQSTSVPVSQQGKSLVSAQTSDKPAIWHYDFQPAFPDNLKGSTAPNFKPTVPGIYRFSLEATDSAGNKSTKNIQVRVVAVGAIPGGVDGAPTVDNIFPADEAADIAITTQVTAWFSEPVDNVNNNTFKLIDTTTGQSVPASVASSFVDGRMISVLSPLGNLAYGRTYQVVLTTSIVDVNPNQSADDAILPLSKEYRSTFTTKNPTAYDLDVTGQFSGGWDIDLYSTNQKTYAYITASDQGWRVVDISDPTSSNIVLTANSKCLNSTDASCRYVPSVFFFRGVAVHPEPNAGLMAITENIVYPDNNQYGYIRFYDIKTDPEKPVIVGREKLAEAYSGIPGRVALSGDYAYVSTAAAALQVVSISAAKDNMSKPTLSDGSSIVGVFDSIGQGYGSPNDIVIYGPGKALLTTNPGYLIVLDVNNPIPVLMSKLDPSAVRAFRVAGVSNYSYNDADGNLQSMDLAVVGGSGRIKTVDLTDPYNPKVLATVKDAQGNELISYPYDISLSSKTGLALVSTLNAVQIVDVKDPKNPRLLNTITQLPTNTGTTSQSGSTETLPIGTISSLVEKNGWLYLADQKQGMKAVDINADIGAAEVKQINVERIYHTAQFDSNVPADAGFMYTDKPQIEKIKITEPSTVTVTILDKDKQNPVVLVPETSLTAGDYRFEVDYGQIKDAGFSLQNPSYYIQVKTTYGNPAVDDITIYSGQMRELTDGKMLGQVMVHDVLIQDGSLNLTRQDFEFSGRGPQLAFTRTYTNQSSSHGITPLGNGWNHSLDLRLKPLNMQSTGAGGIPAWLIPLKGKIFSVSDIPDGPDSWSMVQVNGTIFKKYNGTWYSERGRHGTLEELSPSSAITGFVFTAKDGTRYIYNYALGDMPVSRIEDRNGNVMTFTYEGQLLSKVTDAVGRTCAFSYTAMGGSVGDSNRLTKVSCSDDVKLTFSYDKHGYLKTAKRDTRVETYDYAIEKGIIGGEYNLVKATDANNHSFAYEYFTVAELPLGSWNPNKAVKPLKAQDVVKSVTYPYEGTTPVRARFAYNVTTANKRIVTDLRGHDTAYTLNYFGNPLKIEEPADDSGSVKTTGMTWSIDEGKPDNVMTSKTDPLLYTTTYEYDSRGNVKKETDPYGKAITTAWNLKYSLPESRTDRNGISHTWQYDSKGNLLYEKDGDQKQTNHTYYATGEIQTTTDPRSKTTSYSYDAWGNQASKSIEGGTTRYEHDIRGRQTAMIDPNNNRTEYGYDNLDHPATTTLPAHGSYTLANGSSRVKTQVHDPLGNLKSETNRVGLALTYTYTPRNQVKTISRNIGGAKTFDYDNNGNLVSETDWKGVPITHGYDKLNRRTSTTSRMSQGTQVIRKLMGYDLNGNLTSETDFEGRTTNHEYDKLNRLTKTIQPALFGLDRGELKYTYYDEADPKTNLKTETDQENHTTTYEYNGRYLRTKRINALSGIHAWEYDDAGNPAKEADEDNHVIRHDYDGQNRLVADIHVHNGSDIRTNYGYDPAGNRISVTDPLGHKTETRYDEWNRPWQVTDPDTYTFTTELDGEGNKVKTIDANGYSRFWTYDQRGLELTAIDAEGYTATSTYDANGNRETITEIINIANGTSRTTKIAYDAEDRKTIITEAKGEPEERQTGVALYDKVGNPLQVRDGIGNITTTVYNALNLPEQVCDPAPFNSQCITNEYYRTGKLKKQTNRRQHATSYEYDALNRQVKVTDPLGQTIVTGYDNTGHVTNVKDKRDIVAETRYDDLYRPEYKLRDNKQLFRYEYDDAGNLTSETDADNKRTEHSYNKRNLLARTTYKDSATSQDTYRDFLYDGNHNLIKETDEEKIDTNHVYDKENRLTATERAGETTRKRYDGLDSLLAITHPEGNSRTYEYDKLKRLKKDLDDTLVTAFDYDRNNNLVKRTDPRGNVVEQTYDQLNRLTRRIQKKAAGDLVTSFDLYDPEGNLIDLTDPKGQKEHNTYDKLNRRTQSDFSGGSDTLTVTTGYDANNNVTSSSTPSDSTTSLFDHFDRLQSSTQRGTTVDYTYFDNGNRKSVTINGRKTEYSYDFRNRVKTATDGSATASFDYYPDGKKKTATYPNGAKEEYEYYPTDRVKTVTNSIKGAPFSIFAYTYDKNGNRLTQDEARSGRSIATAYHYDILDRMDSYSVTENNAVTRTGYTFDGYNRKTETVTKPDGTSTTRTYNYDETDWLTQIDDGTKTIAYTYDENGNTITKTDSSDSANPEFFVYDQRDKLIRARKGSTLLGRYEYNANGYRVRQLGSDRGDVEYIYDDKAVIEERNGTGLLAHYRYANKLYSLFDGTTNQYYHQDALGSTVDLTDDSGTTKASYFLNPWGMIVDSIGNSVNRKVFTGKEIDKNTGLIYFGARYYDPDTARFITQDTYLGKTDEPPSLHRFLYAYSNPTVFIDLEGYAAFANDKILDLYYADGMPYKTRNNLDFTKQFAKARGLDRKIEIEGRGYFMNEHSQALDALYSALGASGISDAGDVKNHAFLLIEKGDKFRDLESFILKKMGGRFEKEFRTNKGLRNSIRQRLNGAIQGDLIDLSDAWKMAVESARQRIDQKSILYQAYRDGSFRVPIASGVAAGFIENWHGSFDSEAPPDLRYANRIGLGFDLATLASLPGKGLGVFRAGVEAEQGIAGTARIGFGAEVKLSRLVELPGSKGIRIEGRLSPKQIETLTNEHGVEFSLVYMTGPGRAGRGGYYMLYSGTPSSVQVPLGSNVRWIYHSHPRGTAAASTADKNVLRLLQQTGSPQRSSQIVPVGKKTMRFQQ